MVSGKRKRDTQLLPPDAFFARYSYGPPEGQPYADPRIGLSKVPEWNQQRIDGAVTCPVEDMIRPQQNRETRREFENAPVNEGQNLPIMDMEEAETGTGSNTLDHSRKEPPKDRCCGKDPLSKDDNFADTVFECEDEDLSKTRIFAVKYTHDGKAYTIRVLEGGDGAVWEDIDALVHDFQPDLHYSLPEWQAFLSPKQHQIKRKSISKLIKLGLQKALLVYTFAVLEFLSECGPPGSAHILGKLANYARLTEADRPVWFPPTFLISYQDVNSIPASERKMKHYPDDARYVYQCEDSTGRSAVASLRVRNEMVEQMPLMDMLFEEAQSTWSEERKDLRKYMVTEASLVFRGKHERAEVHMVEFQHLLQQVGMGLEASARWDLDSGYHKGLSKFLSCGACGVAISRDMTSNSHPTCRRTDGGRGETIRLIPLASGCIRECASCKEIFVSPSDWEKHQQTH